MRQPQEIEVWYILPTIRKEIANHLIQQFHFSQKKAAHTLGVTEAAISQYKKKRALKIKFNAEFKKKIVEAAQKIAQNEEKALYEIQKVCKLFKQKKLLCQVHKKYDTVPTKCEACLK